MAKSFLILTVYMMLLLPLSCTLTTTHLPVKDPVAAVSPVAKTPSTVQASGLEAYLWDYLVHDKLSPAVAQQVATKNGTPPSPDSIEEALLVIVLLERVTGKVGVSLRAVALSYNFDILQALNSNPFLNYPRFFAKAVRVLGTQAGDSDFYRDLESLLLARLERFRNDLDTLETLLTLPTAQSERTAAQVAREIDTDLFRSGDNTLLEAESLATQGEYQNAIKKIATLEEHSPLFQIAQEKLIEISNKAVHDLRKRAALAFQKAGPITDQNTRAAYLNEAKSYLEQALTLYPQAENLHTVRSNLVIIARDLEKLQRVATP